MSEQENKQENSKQDNQAEAQPVFSVEKIYVKDLSLEVPHAPQIFLEQGEPNVEMRISTQSDKLEEGYYNVAVTVTVTARLGEERVMFLNEVTQSGIFRLENIPADDEKLLLGVACPNILFPYARETVSSTITRAGFPPVILAPINFEAMFQQQQEQGNA
ncbi:Protein-export protein secB [Kingella potus]|uniref:Protein-export protein SecB n=1 Tax=Kingella potus TaxID=265175 RepID=A0A377R2L1_9NEIS|nr:protein-export chaperone SecB [Kingella potus]UOP00596.1 protein-export chaperone SecB [Kingella potus]STR03007.1 Protein-export protein secB [Kingella potus]